jgi:hypothetical protein
MAKLLDEERYFSTGAGERSDEKSIDFLYSNMEAMDLSRK